MGSSKIQEYNLDPNMGLAKEESVQEILSKVNNIGDASKIGKSIIEYRKTGSSLSAMTELFNIAGKGKFYWANCWTEISMSNTYARLTSSNSKTSFRITLDGEVIAYYTTYPNGDEIHKMYTYNLLCSNQTLLYQSSGVNTNPALIPLSNYVKAVPFAATNFYPFSSTEQSKTVGSSSYGYHYATSLFIDALQFNESLKIELYNYSTDTYKSDTPSHDYYLTVGYTLDD